MRQRAGTKMRYQRAHAAPLASVVNTRMFVKESTFSCKPSQRRGFLQPGASPLARVQQAPRKDEIPQLKTSEI